VAELDGRDRRLRALGQPGRPHVHLMTLGVAASRLTSRPKLLQLRAQYEAAYQAAQQYWAILAALYAVHPAIQPGIGAIMGPASHPHIGAVMGPAIRLGIEAAITAVHMRVNAPSDRLASQTNRLQFDRTSNERPNKVYSGYCCLLGFPY
jgi:hypothetical protein